jgi:small-conductance mechanosensitive channel
MGRDGRKGKRDLTTVIKIGITVLVCAGLYFLLGQIGHRQKKLHVGFACSLLRIIVVIICVTLLIGQLFDLGAFTQTLLTSGGLFLAVLTFAAQKVLNNILSGISISASKPFEIGQKIRVLQNGNPIAEGVVKSISLRHTVINTYDGQSCIIPNGVLSESVVVNANYTEEVGNFLEVTVRYQDDIDRAIGLVQETVDAEPLVTRRGEPLVSRYLEDGVQIKTAVWTRTLNDNFQACSNIRRNLLKVFRAAGIAIPYRTVTLDMPEQGAVRQEGTTCVSQ